MRHNIIDTLDKSLATAKQFVDLHGKALANTDAELQVYDSTIRLDVYPRDLARIGEVFGKHGWTRKLEYGGSVNWTKTVDGVTIFCYNAEENTLNGSEVPPQLFPLQLNDSNEPELN